MPELPQETNLVYKALELYDTPEPLRPYLGYSSLGHECSRYLWYYFRWMFTVKISPRQKRLFSRGDQEEPILVKDLTHAGMQCRDVLDDQIELIGCLGHVMGHPDGSVLNVPGAEKTDHNLEIKTANEKRFTEFKRFGVQRTSPAYYGQCQCYMGKKKQTRTLFCITNKNTDERYYERLEYDKGTFDELEEKAFDIISSPVPLKGISEKPEWYQCKWCDAKEVCHQGKPYERNCRTCANVRIEDKGEWHCAIYQAGPIPVKFQRTGCPDHYRPFL